MKPTVKVKKLTETAVLPKYSTLSAAGADLCANTQEEIVIKPGQTVFVKTGISLEIPEGYVGLIYARSSSACKRGLAPANKVGVIDSDYRGEVMVALLNHSDTEQTIQPNERIAQLVITPYLAVDFTESDELSDTTRGEGGFGSTGKI